MKRTPMLLLASVLAVPLYAQPAPAEAAAKPTVQRLESDPQRLPRLIAQIRAAREAARGCYGTQAITGNRSTRAILFPAAGSVRGAGGEFFRSDVTIDSRGKVAVFWLGRGATGEPPAFIVEGQGPFGYPITYTDFVGETLKIPGGLGALLMIPLDEFGNLDEEGIIDGFSRIWTNQPGRTGTVSQQFQAVDPFAFNFYYDTKALGLQHNAQYRTSWGIVNLDDVPHQFRVFPTSLANNTSPDLTITVPAFSLTQQGLTGDFGTEGMTVYIRLLDDFEGDPPTFVAFASSTDNQTGDGWVVLSSADWEEEDFPPGQ